MSDFRVETEKRLKIEKLKKMNTRKRNQMIIGVILASIIISTLVYSFGKKIGKLLYHNQNDSEKVQIK